MEKYFGLEIFDKNKYIKDRENCITHKIDAVSVHFDELNGIINITKFSKRFFGKSHSWFSQRLNGCDVMNKEMSFKEEECEQIATAFEELANQLYQYAKEIKKAK